MERGEQESSRHEIGVELRAEFRQACREIIEEMGGDNAAEFMERLAMDTAEDNGVSPDLLGDMQRISPGAAQAVFDRWEAISEANNQAFLAQTEAEIARLDEMKNNTHTIRTLSLGQRALKHARQILDGFATFRI